MTLRHLIKRLACTALCVFSITAHAQFADTVFINGKVLTVDSDFTITQSLAITDGHIIAVGNNETIEPFIGDDTQVITLDGKTVIPGLIDNHFHFIRGVWNNQLEARFDGITSRKVALEHLKEKAQQSEPGSWVTVMGGWSLDQFRDNNSPFTLQELNEVAPLNPLFLMRTYSDGFANGRAFDLAKLDNNGDARLSGRDSLSPLINQVTWRNKSASSEAILAYMKELNSVGLTTVYDVGRPSEGKLEPLEALSKMQDLPLRVLHTLRYSASDEQSVADAIQVITGGETRPRSNTQQFGLLGLGEHIYLPVSDSTNHIGQWAQTDWRPFTSISYAAAQHGWPVHEHVMSRDTAVQYLDLVETIAQEIPTVKDLRWTFAHVNGMREEDINRAASLGVALAVHSQARMSVKVSDAPLFGSIERSGALWGLGSDAGIVASILPFSTLEWVITGENIAGIKSWSDEQRINREQALIAHTINNAKLLFMEAHIGSLEVGKRADLLVLDKDYLSVDESEISQIKPILTMTNGKIVFEQNQ